MNAAASLCMLALAAVAAWAVLRPYQHTRVVALERLADALEDERGRALRHLRDLDDDRACGKLDDARYRVARADAEARAVAVLRALEARERTGELAVRLREVRAAQPRGQAPAPARRRAVAAGVLTSAVLLAATVMLLRGAVGAREAGQQVTGATIGAGVGDDLSSLEFFQRRVREHPGDVAAHLDLGQRYLAAGQVKQATSVATPLPRRSGSSASCWPCRPRAGHRPGSGAIAACNWSAWPGPLRRCAARCSTCFPSLAATATSMAGGWTCWTRPARWTRSSCRPSGCRRSRHRHGGLEAGSPVSSSARTVTGGATARPPPSFSRWSHAWPHACVPMPDQWCSRRARGAICSMRT